MTETIAFLVGLMTFWVPPATDTEIVRYTHIAADSVAVAKEKDWLGLSQAETAAVILSIASFESGYRKDIDHGIVRGDGGKSVCLGQVQVPRKYREIVATDRRACFRAMLEHVAYSWDWCHRLPWHERLSGYTVGKCVRSKTSRKYSARMLEAFDGIEDLGFANR